jgi:trypsin-like peptidase
MISEHLRIGLLAPITMGIVSATGRKNLRLQGPGGYEDFIQTDAAINPGNSGGALVDITGQLIGINTAIITSGGWRLQDLLYDLASHSQTTLRGCGPSRTYPGVGESIRPADYPRRACRQCRPE